VIVARRHFRRGAPPAAPVIGVTVDLWYTLLYVRAAERRRIEAERQRRWRSALEGAGAGAGRARAAWRSVQQWVAAEESAGRAPTITRQAEHAAAAVGRPVDGRALAGSLDEVMQGADVLEAPGAEIALRTLRDRGLRIGVVSNIVHESSEATRRLLAQTRFAPMIRTVQLSADLPWSKPHPGPYRRALAAMGVPPSCAVHVGDQAIDRLGAERAGLRCLLYTGLWRWAYPKGRSPGPPRAPAGLRAASWREVTERLAAWSTEPCPWPDR
jgi:HAD superfamily hydrolase (TIGR01549 family)